MGSRGNFIDVETNDFEFCEGSQTYKTIGEIDGIQVLIRESLSVKAPEYSHTPNRIYAIVQDGRLKHLSYYDENHNQSVCIDLGHYHKGLKPHKHLYLNHNDKGIKITPEEQALIDKVRKAFNLQ